MAGHWRNWSGGVTARPAAIHAPADEAALAAILREAPGPVRVAGSGHSFTPLVETDGTLIDLAGLAGIVAIDAGARTARIRAGTKVHALGRPLFDAGLALLNQGDIDRQTIAGALATGTHGTGRTLQCLSAAVTSFRLMAAGGEVLTCAPDQNAALFDLGRVHLGALGIVTEVTVQLRDAYRLRSEEHVLPVEEGLAQLLAQSKTRRHVEVFWFPYADTCIVKTLDETAGAAEDPPDARAMAAAGQSRSAAEHAFVALCEAARVTPGLAGAVSRRIAGAFADSAVRTRWSFHAFPSARTVPFEEMEYALPLAQGIEAVRELAAAIRRARIATCFPIELRLVAADDIALSPFHERESMTIAVHQYAPADGTALWRLAETVFARHGGRPHWGKRHSRGARDLAALYPRFSEFQALRAELDPQGRFLNAHLRHIFGTI